VVTPRVEASPDRSDFAKLGETIAASLVQATQQHASVLLEKAKQFADDIRSQVAESREQAEMNEWLIAFGDSLLAAPGRHPSLAKQGSVG
jgi:hypothetical protein